MASQAMADLMEKYRLTDADLNKQVTDIHIEKLSHTHCKDWRRLPPYLGLSRTVRGDIDHDSGKDKAKRYDFFTEWKDRKRADATYRVLIDALSEIECRSDAEFVCQLIQPAVDCRPVHSSTSTQTTTATADTAITSTRTTSATTYTPISRSTTATVIKGRESTTTTSSPLLNADLETTAGVLP